MTYRTERNTMTAVLAATLCMLWSMATWADPLDGGPSDCPLVGGNYAAEIQHQSSSCTVNIDDTTFAPAFVGVTVYCDGKAPAWSPGLWVPSPESCELYLHPLKLGGVVIAAEGEEIEVTYGSGFGMPQVLASGPQDVCDQAAAGGYLQGGAEVWNVTAEGIVEEADGDTRFVCTYDTMWFGSVVRGSTAPHQGQTWGETIASGGDIYMPSNIEYWAELVLDSATGVLEDSAAGVVTDGARGANPGYVRLIPQE